MQNLQLLASNPKASCWVNASAGTGKTKVLIDRILRLLLNGAKPDKILCLTFSKAAANEMQARLEAQIKKWADCDNSFLAAELAALGEKSSDDFLKTAKSLSAQINHNSVAIQTVHSFCNELLQKFSKQFVYEKSFRIMEVFEEKTYLDLAFQKLLEDSDEFLVLEDFLSFHNENVLFDYLCRSRQTFNNLNEASVSSRLKELFDVESEPFFPNPSSEIIDMVQNLFAVIFPQEDDIEMHNNFVQIFLTQKGGVRKNILSKNMQSENAGFEIILKNYAEQLSAYYLQKLRYNQVQKSLYFWRLQNKFGLLYNAIKQTKKLWDFNDLIKEALRLFESDKFDEILLALSYSIDHLLVDEAQDTSVQQWKIIQHVVESIMQIEDERRTLFVVGDAKQLIYSFQGAELNYYEKMREFFASICPNWCAINLHTSFRSYQQILDVVDTVFKESVGLGAQQVKHVSFHENEGSLEVLPLVDLVVQTQDDWPIFTKITENITTEDNLATQVIDYIEELNLDDVMILMRRRGRLMQALEKQAILKNISYHASHSINLLDKLSVQDLLSIVEFMLMPLNELNLSGLLKTDFMQKIGSITEELLFDLCHKRTQNLWYIVQEKLPLHTKILKELLANNTGNAYHLFLKAYQFLESNDYYLDQFMEEVFKRFNYLDVGIRELIEHIYTFPPNFNKLQAHADGDLKILTVHGSKGLEAENVIILDDGEKPSLKQDVCLFDPVLEFWFLKPTQQADTILTSALKEYQQKAIEHEYERLLYVALTRARKHLVVGGVKHDEHDYSWYWRVHNAIN